LADRRGHRQVGRAGISVPSNAIREVCRPLLPGIATGVLGAPVRLLVAGSVV
jgi:hypothetical protein